MFIPFQYRTVAILLMLVVLCSCSDSTDVVPTADTSDVTAADSIIPDVAFDSVDTSELTEPANLAVTWNSDLLEDPLGRMLFPSIIAHLMPAFWEAPCVQVTNNGSSPTAVRVSAELVGFSQVSQGELSIAGGATEEVCVTPSFDLLALAALHDEIQGRFVVKAASEADWEASLPQELPVTILPVNMMPWFNRDLWPFVGVMVLPRDPAVRGLQDDMNQRSQYGGFGTGGYNYVQQGSGYVAEVVDGTCVQAAGTYFESDEKEIVVRVVSMTNRSDVDLGLADRNGNWIVYRSGVTNGQTVTFAVPNEGIYVLHFCLPASAVFNANEIRFVRTLTTADRAWDYLQAIFYLVRDQGVSYANISSSYLLSPQTIRRPDEVLQTGAGNCIEGALLFASFLELNNVEPVLLLSLANGHAFVGVRTSPGSDMIWTVETTMVGGTSSFGEAIEAGMLNYACWANGTGCTGSGTTGAQDPEAMMIDIKKLRDAGVSPQPY